MNDAHAFLLVFTYALLRLTSLRFKFHLNLSVASLLYCTSFLQASDIRIIEHRAYNYCDFLKYIIV